MPNNRWNRNVEWRTWPWHHSVAAFLLSSLAVYLLLHPDRFGVLQDYREFLTQLMSNRLYFQRNGLFAIPYYTPALMGGSPRWADPNDMAISIVQLFFNLAPYPQTGLALAFVACTALGYLGAVRFLRGFGVSPWIAAAGGLLFSFNGFVINQWIVGHIWIQTFWIVPWALCHVRSLVMRPDPNSRVVPALWLSLLFAMTVYGAGYNVTLFTVFLMATYVLIFRVGHQDPGARISSKRFLVWLSIPVVTVLLGASKLLASWEYMSLFPRDIANEDFGFALFAVLLRGLVDPTITLSTRFAYFGIGWWEYSAYIGILTSVGAIAGILMAIRGDDALRGPVRWALLSTLLCFYMAMGENVVWHFLKPLPPFKSLHVTTRLVAVLPLPWILVACLALQRIGDRFRRPVWPIVFAFLCVLDVIAYQKRNDDRIFTDRVFAKDPLGPRESFMIQGWVARGSDPAHLVKGLGDLVTSNPLFGYSGEKILTRIDPRVPPWQRFTDGTLNIHDPVALLYPKDVARAPWSMLSADTPSDQLKRFLSFENPHFYVPRRQKVANAVSVLTLLAVVAVLLWPKKAVIVDRDRGTMSL